MLALPVERHHHHHQATTTTAAAGKEHGGVVEEIQDLIKVYKDGYVDRLPLIPEVPASWSPEPDVTSRDTDIATGLSARIYVPAAKRRHRLLLLPVIVYFHGGGFCVGSASWRCYHEFLSRLSSKSSAVIVSVNYRLAPEHRLPAAYEDGASAVRWVKQPPAAGEFEHLWWRSRCDFGRLFVAGDSSGAAVAYFSASAAGGGVRGLVLIQPFFGGEMRTRSEEVAASATRSSSALSLATSDCYWRLALPKGVNRDHRWCNPMGKGGGGTATTTTMPNRTMVCVAELDILRDRNLELCRGLRSRGHFVEHHVYAGVGHAFQLLLHNSSPSAHVRAHDLMTHIKSFIATS